MSSLFGIGGGGNVGAAGGGSFYSYSIDQSLRFDRASSSYLTRTPSSAGNRKTFTLSFWYKNCDNTNQHAIFGSRIDGDNQFILQKNTSSGLDFYSQTGGSITVRMITSSVFRDVSAWYHIVLKVDVTTGTSANAIYVNGVEQSLTTDTSSNANTYVNSTVPHQIGRWDTGGYINAYMAEVHFIDGTALDPTSFGETIGGVWVPKEYDTADGAYGTNGFYLSFADSSAIGDDLSGNTNDFTANNLAAHDVVPDSPTNNFATLNFLDSRTSQGWKEGGLNWLASSSGYTAHSTMVIPEISDSDTYYAEVRVNAAGYAWGISPVTLTGANNSTTRTGMLTVYHNGRRYNGATAVDGANYDYCTPAVGDIFGIKAGNGKLEFFQNGTSLGDAFTSLSGTYKFGCWAIGAAGTGITWNFGQDSTFHGQETAGTTTDANGQGLFNDAEAANNIALCASNIAEPTISPNAEAQADDYFNTVLYTGNGSTQSITGVGFQPDWVWIKQRNGTRNNVLYDSVRGATERLISNTTDAEATAATALTSFDADGFSLGNGTTSNENSKTYVSWNWKAGGTAVSNTDGSITSQVSAAPDAGVSIMSWTGTGANATVGHGLAKTPEIVILKNRNYASAFWTTWTKFNTNDTILGLNLTNALFSSPGSFIEGDIDNTTIGVGTERVANGSGEGMIAYCFHSVDGFSKVGSYVGNGSADGTFIYTGFRPAFWLMKSISDATHWVIYDSARETFNAVQDQLLPNEANAEAASGRPVDFLSNGVKLRFSAYLNDSGQTYIYLAFAEAPFKYANAR